MSRIALHVVMALAACSGDDDGSTSSSPDDPVEGTLRTFTYDDSIDPAIIDPFEEQYPDVKVETATFNSNAQAAAKIRGGFGTDVIEVCSDESSPLVDNGLLAPIDTSKITQWDNMLPSFQNADGVTEDGKTWLVPLSAGPHGLIYDVERFRRAADELDRPVRPRSQGAGRVGRRWRADSTCRDGAVARDRVTR